LFESEIKGAWDIAYGAIAGQDPSFTMRSISKNKFTDGGDTLIALLENASIVCLSPLWLRA
jgi:hypothetical protein